MIPIMGLSISHLLFADNTILFVGASREQLLYIRIVLFFGSCHRLESQCWSEIVPMSEVGNLNALADILYCKVGGSFQGYIDMESYLREDG